MDDEHVIGFDGSKGRKRGRADSTALVGIRLSDAYLWVEGLWSDPQEGEGWTPPRDEIRQRVEGMFERGAVGGRFDPAAGWGDDVARWTSRYRSQLWVGHLAFSSPHYQAEAYDSLYDAIAHNKLRVDFDRDPELRTHFLAGFSTETGGVQKEHRGASAGLVDLLAASAYAYRAFLDATANRPRPSPPKWKGRDMNGYAIIDYPCTCGCGRTTKGRFAGEACIARYEQMFPDDPQMAKWLRRNR